jgi:hypothetical protein
MRHNWRMTDEQFRALRRLILEQGLKVEALSLEVRNLKQAMETTEVRLGQKGPKGVRLPSVSAKGESGHPPIRRRAAIPTSFAAPDQLVIASNGSTLDADLE